MRKKGKLTLFFCLLAGLSLLFRTYSLSYPEYESNNYNKQQTFSLKKAFEISDLDLTNQLSPLNLKSASLIIHKADIAGFWKFINTNLRTENSIATTYIFPNESTPIVSETITEDVEIEPLNTVNPGTSLGNQQPSLEVTQSDKVKLKTTLPVNSPIESKPAEVKIWPKALVKKNNPVVETPANKPITAPNTIPTTEPVKPENNKDSNKLNQITLSIEPKNNSTFLAGAKITIKATTIAPNSEKLEYQFSIEGSVRQTWSASNVYDWQTSDLDTGAAILMCEVKDNKGLTASQNISYQIINPTVEETLQKVADNYAKIHDFKADMVFSSTLNGQPFGETEYCRYFFMSPDKEKTETFSDSSRITKTDIIIMDGSIIHMINPVDSIKQRTDLLKENNITDSQFNQMNIYYNQDNFLKNHTITKNDLETNFDKIIVALDATPNKKSDLYTKLRLYVDYTKGLLVKMEFYKNDELPQSIEVTITNQMPNKAWLPIEMTKNPNLLSAALISTVNYSDLRINTGLTNSDFDPNKQY